MQEQHNTRAGESFLFDDEVRIPVDDGAGDRGATNNEQINVLNHSENEEEQKQKQEHAHRDQQNIYNNNNNNNNQIHEQHQQHKSHELERNDHEQQHSQQQVQEFLDQFTFLATGQEANSGNNDSTVEIDVDQQPSLFDHVHEPESNLRRSHPHHSDTTIDTPIDSRCAGTGSPSPLLMQQEQERAAHNKGSSPPTQASTDEGIHVFQNVPNGTNTAISQLANTHQDEEDAHSNIWPEDEGEEEAFHLAVVDNDDAIIHRNQDQHHHDHLDHNESHTTHYQLHSQAEEMILPPSAGTGATTSTTPTNASSTSTTTTMIPSKRRQDLNLFDQRNDDCHLNNQTRADITNNHTSNVECGTTTVDENKRKRLKTVDTNASTAAVAATSTTITSGDGGGGGAEQATYVLRIHEMLEDAERTGRTDVVSWRPHGRAFRIHKEEVFVQEILPKYFNAKIGSFRRWLRAWGFCRMTEGKDRGSWYHRFFVRGVTRFCKDLSRQQMAQAMAAWPPGNQIPDFYSASTGNLFSEDTTIIPAPLPAASSRNNPKLLRGTLLEDLRQLLSDAEQEGHTDIASWLPHGRAFKIYDRRRFEGLMPRYFRTSVLSNLSDTLRMWGFRRFKEQGPDKGCYYHRKFVRGNPALSRHVPREEMKAAMIDWPPPEGEPDLTKERLLLESNAISLPSSYVHPYSVSFSPGHSQTLNRLIHGGINEPMVNTMMTSHCDANEADRSFGRTKSIDSTENTAGNTHQVTYVLRLHEMLEDSEREQNTHIISWQPHGRAFLIKKEQDFIQHIMPRYFKAQMKSFLRWCRAWGFVRMTEGRDRGAWFHRYFVRGVTSMCRNMTRQQMLKSMEGFLPSGQVPDFYASGSSTILSELSRPSTLAMAANGATAKNPKRLRGTVPEDLRQMLEQAENDGNTSIVSWCIHGRAFAIYDKAAFTDHVLPHHFKASKFTYFSDAIRQWGFRRLKQGPDKGAYYHKLFVKGRPELTRHLTRIQMNQSMTPWPPANGEPNLHAESIAEIEDTTDGPLLDADALIAAAETAEAQEENETTTANELKISFDRMESSLPCSSSSSSSSSTSSSSSSSSVVGNDDVDTTHVEEVVVDDDNNGNNVGKLTTDSRGPSIDDEFDDIVGIEC